jgi:hypothetical protein
MKNNSKSIIVHIGHSKTGSSFIQSSLDKSVDRLFHHGVSYPSSNDRKTVSDSYIRSGNTRAKQLDRTCKKFVTNSSGATPILLLSNERLFDSFATNENYFRFLSALDASVRIILFTRDPLDFAISSYNQLLKRHGYVDTFDEFIGQFDYFDLLFSFFELAKHHSIAVDFLNYSNIKEPILDKFSDLIGVPRNTLEAPDVDVVNRSLSEVEMYIQQQFNKKYGREARKFVANPLCEKLPCIKNGFPFFAEKSFSQFKDKMNKNILVFNDEYALNGDQKYNLITDAHYSASLSKLDKIAGEFLITAEQLDVLVDSLHKELINPFTAAKRWVKWKMSEYKSNTA